MPGTLSVTVGTTVSTIDFSGTNSKINAVILRVLAARGKSIDGLTAVQIGELFLTELKKIAINISAEAQSKELTAANESAIKTTVAADNSI